jgi:hypothetical protein
VSTHGIAVCTSSCRPARRSAKTTAVIAIASVAPRRTASNQAGRSGSRSTAAPTSTAAVSTLLWIVKKLKKLPATSVPRSCRTDSW